MAGRRARFINDINKSIFLHAIHLGCLNFSAIAAFRVVTRKCFGQSVYGQTGLPDDGCVYFFFISLKRRNITVKKATI